MAQRRLLVVLFLLVLGASPTFAGEAASLLVRAVDRHGRPIAEAVVQAGLPPEEVGDPEREVWQGKTSADGTVRLAGLSTDEPVWLLIERRGFVPFVRSLKLRTGERREMRIMLRSGGVAVGRVVDEAGRPVADAEVELSSGDLFGTSTDELPAFLRDQARRKTRTGPAGRFRYRDLPEGSFELAVRHPSHAPLQADQPVQGGDRSNLGRFVLRSGARLTGTVSDPDGRPIAGLPLWAVTALTHWNEETPPSATTGPDGRFEILHLPPGQLDLHACGQGYLQQSVTVRFFDGPVDLTLQPAATLSGRVLGPDGAPLAGADVSALKKWTNGLNFSAQGNHWTPCPVSEWATSDAEGRFIVGPLVPGWYELRARTDDLLLGAVSKVRAAAGEPVEGIEIHLASGRAGALAGRVLDTSGAPIAKARVTASTETSYEVAAAADGSYRFEQVGRGHLTLQASASGYEDLQRETEVTSTEARLDLVLARDESCACTPVTVRGHVAGPDGAPVEGAMVSSLSAKTWTAADGTFEVLVTRPRLLEVSKPGFASRQVELSADNGEDVEIRLDTGTVIAGRLLGMTAEDRDATTYAALSCEDEASRMADLRADGTFRFEHVPPEACDLRACVDERCAQTSLVLEPGQDEVPVVLELAEAYPVSGQVLDALGQPVAGAELLATPPDDELAITAGASGGTRADGRFVLRLPDGTYDLRAQKEGLRERSVELHVEGGPVTGLEIRLEPSTILRGRLFGLEPGEAPEIVAQSPATQAYGEVGLDSYTISDLEPGTWTIEASLEEGDGPRVLHRTFEVLPGISEITLDLDFAEAEMVPKEAEP